MQPRRAPITYPEGVVVARRELSKLAVQRDEICRLVGQSITRLRKLARDLPSAQEAALLHDLRAIQRGPSGITVATSETLKAFRDGLTAAQVRGHLEESGFDLGCYSSPLTEICRTLKRLSETGRAEVSKRGRRFHYKWVAGK
jgi:hypothetical protein